MPGFRFQTGEQLFAGVHQARQWHVRNSGDITKWMTGNFKHADRQLVMWVGRFPLQRQLRTDTQAWLEPNALIGWQGVIQHLFCAELTRRGHTVYDTESSTSVLHA